MSILASRLSVAGLAAVLLFSCACGGIVETFSDLQALREGVRAKFPAGDVTVALSNGDQMGVSLINSPAGNLPDDQQKGKAREVAVWVIANYKGSASIKNIQITFASQTKLLWIIPVTKTQIFSFPASELKSDVGVK
jgi:hypothetical protein